MGHAWGGNHETFGHSAEDPDAHRPSHHAERRRSFRVHIDGQASVWRKGLLKGQYHVRDLSIGGCLLIAGPERSRGEDIDVLLRLPHREPLFMSGSVARTGRSFTGVRFAAPSPRAEDCIQELVLDALAHDREPDDDIVLVVEPRADRRHLLTKALRELGLRAIAVGTALDAVQLLVEEGPHVRAAFIDVASRVLQSRELVEFLAHNHPSVRRVLTGEAFELRGAWIDEATGEVDGLLEAPFHTPSLRHLLVRLGCPPHDASLALS